MSTFQQMCMTLRVVGVLRMKTTKPNISQPSSTLSGADAAEL